VRQAPCLAHSTKTSAIASSEPHHDIKTACLFPPHQPNLAAGAGWSGWFRLACVAL